MEVERAGRPWEAASRLAILVVAVVASMSLAQDVLKPLALAVLLAFVFAPVVRFVERRLPRAAAVTLTVGLGLGALGSLGYVVASELMTLAEDLPRYQTRIERKVEQLVPSQQGAFSRLADVAQRIDVMISPRTGARAVPQVRVVPEVSLRERFEEALAPYLGVLGVGSIVLVLVVFLLLQREDMSDRIIRLFGHRKIGLTTRTMDEAGRRISRYLAAFTAVNAGYGLLIGLGLWADRRAAAGALGGARRRCCASSPTSARRRRFVLPLLLSVVVSDGWREPMLVVGAVRHARGLRRRHARAGASTADHRRVVGRAAGGGDVLGLAVGADRAAAVDAADGRLAVVGRYVPQLGFFATLLGGEPALAEPLRLYHRLLAGDEAGARTIVEAALRQAPARVGVRRAADPGAGEDRGRRGRRRDRRRRQEARRPRHRRLRRPARVGGHRPRRRRGRQAGAAARRRARRRRPGVVRPAGAAHARPAARRMGGRARCRAGAALGRRAGGVAGRPRARGRRAVGAAAGRTRRRRAAPPPPCASARPACRCSSAPGPTRAAPARARPASRWSAASPRRATACSSPRCPAPRWCGCCSARCSTATARATRGCTT